MSDTHSEHKNRSGTVYLSGDGEMVIELQGFGMFDYNIQTAPGYPAGSNSQDSDMINLKIERIGGASRFFNRSRRIDLWFAIVRWNVTVPYILNYIVE